MTLAFFLPEAQQRGRRRQLSSIKQARDELMIGRLLRYSFKNALSIRYRSVDHEAPYISTVRDIPAKRKSLCTEMQSL
jgi:hypothetical protein